jgi:hypothetical protein
MPLLAAAAAGLAQVREAVGKARGSFTTDADLHAEALDLVLAGKPVPADLGARTQEVRQHNEALSLQLEALGRLEIDLYGQRRDSVGKQVDLGLHVLADHLAAILTDARPAATALAGIDSPQAAIDADLSAEWSVLRRLATRHDELRQAQAVLVSEALFPPDDARRQTGVVKREAGRLVDSYGAVRNFDDLYPAGLPDAGKTVPGSSVSIVNGRVVTTAISETSVDAPPWLTGDGTAALRYLAGPDAQPWVPSLDQLTATRDAATERRAGPQPEVRSSFIGPARERSIDRKMAFNPSTPSSLGNPEY